MGGRAYITWYKVTAKSCTGSLMRDFVWPMVYANLTYLSMATNCSLGLCPCAGSSAVFGRIGIHKRCESAVSGRAGPVVMLRGALVVSLTSTVASLCNGTWSEAEL